MTHSQNLAKQFLTLHIGKLTSDEKLNSQLPLEYDADSVIANILDFGGSRPIWDVKEEKDEHILMAWPKETLLRTGIILAGESGGDMNVAAFFPFMEGFENPMKFVNTFAWKDGHVGEFCCQPNGLPPMWFFDPLFYRDTRENQSEGEIRTYFLSGLCYGIRPALLDELTITTGPYYEKHAMEWMKANPDKKRLDVPPLKIPLKGKNLIDWNDDPCCDYQARAAIFNVESFMFGPAEEQCKIYCFGISAGNPDHPVNILMYAPEYVCLRNYVPKEGDEVDVTFWLQGRMVDIKEGDLEKISEEPQTEKNVPEKMQ